jgi:hypothetical protein
MAIRVGNYIIHHPSKGKVWIQAMDGEGGQFDVEQVEEALNLMWAKYF